MIKMVIDTAMDALPFESLYTPLSMILVSSFFTSIGKPFPAVCIRTSTERPEALAAGTVKLVGTDCDLIINEVSKLIEDSEYYDKMSKAVNPYGDGLASNRIVDILRNI